MSKARRYCKTMGYRFMYFIDNRRFMCKNAQNRTVIRDVEFI